MTEGQEQEAILELDFMIYDAIQASVPVGTTYRYEEQGNHYYDHNGVITNSYSMLRFRETLHIAEVTKGPGHYLSPDGFTLQSREPVPNQILSWEITFKGPASFKDGIRTCVELSDGFDVDDGTRVQIPDTFEFKEFLWPNVYTPLKALGITSVEKLGSLYTQRFFLEFFGIEVCLDHSILPDSNQEFFLLEVEHDSAETIKAVVRKLQEKWPSATPTTKSKYKRFLESLKA